MSIFRIFNKNKEDKSSDATQLAADYSSALHKYSADARARSELFSSFLGREYPNFKILPGRYGGEYNNDMLAIGETKNGETSLILGIKISDSNGGLQMDDYSLGPFNQLSSHWLDALIYILSIANETKSASERIKSAKIDGTLITAVLFILRTKNNQLTFLRVNVPNKDSYS